MWNLVFTKQAQKDALKIREIGLKPKAEYLLILISENPFATPPFFEKLKGDLNGLYSRRINSQHRLIYQIYQQDKTIKVLRMWTHYE